MAAPVNGTLQLVGMIAIDTASMSFCPNSVPCSAAPGNWNAPGTGTGDLANPYANDPNGGLITNLNSVNAPVGAVLPGNGLLFLTFSPSAALPVPDIEFFLTTLLPGVGGTAACGAAPSPGQTCSPAGSALSLVNGAGGTSSATINMQGKARRISTSEFDSLQMSFSSQFNFPFQTLLSVLGAGGTVTVSYMATATASSPPVAPAFQSAVSRKIHGAAGTFDLGLSAVDTNPTTEPRQGPAQTIVFTFDKPIASATATITEGTAAAGAPAFSGNDVIVGLSGVSNKQYVTIALTNVSAVDGGTGGSGSVRVGFLLADVNQNRVVTVSDIVLVNAQIAHVVTSANFLKDVNANGILTVGDKLITNNNVTKALPAP
jgi:hypothetical protein